MKKRMRLLAFLLAAVLLVGGCGTPLHELTDEETDLVVQYAAYALAKHNIYQKDGMTNALPEEENTQQEQQQSKQDTQNQPTVSPGSSGGDAKVQQQDTISLAAAIGHESDLVVTYKGYSIKDSYQEGDYFSVNASEGKKLLIMDFQIKNPGSKEMKLDTLSMNASFLGCFDGTSWVPEKVTFGSNSLSSYDGKLKAGATQKAVLIFEISQKAAENVTTENLSVNLDGKRYSVEL